MTMAKKEPTEEMRLRKEMEQLGKGLDAIRKRANQLMKKSPALTNEERAELDQLMQEIPGKQSQLAESMSKVLKASSKA
jgi:hypothetical protein